MKADQADDAADAQSLTIRRPDDMHVHLRDGAMLHAVAPYTASHFSRAIVMPNLTPPVRTLADAVAYRSRIMSALPPGTHFTPLMTLYLTDDTSATDIEQAFHSGLVHAGKLYPAGATTNSALGVTSLTALAPALSAMQRVGMPLCIHGEVASPLVDIFDREAAFIADVLPGLLASYPTLRVVLEHVTTKDAADFVVAHAEGRVAATVTAHHLLYSRMALFEHAKIHPHMFCLPVLKRETHRLALLQAIDSDDKGLFFAGTDSAPHTSDSKISADGCAGIFTANHAVALYAEAFDQAGMLGKLEQFCSVNGATFYGLPLNKGSITLQRQQQKVVDSIAVNGMEGVVPLRAGKTVNWTVTASTTD